MIAYEAIGELAHVLAGRLNCDANPHVLLATSANMSAISAYEGFLAAAKSLQDIYEKALQSAAPRPRIGANAVGGDFGLLASPIQNAASALASLKASTTQAGSSFAPADQALFSYLEKYAHCLVTMPYPDNYAAGNSLMVSEIQKVMDIRADTIAAYIAAYNRTHPDPSDQAKYDPTANELKGIETSYNAFLGLLTGPGGNSIGIGAALQAATTSTYLVLTLADVAAGGSTRANTYFLLNLFVPAPHPSYNGGAVVSYTLRTQSGAFVSADMLRLVYGPTKWPAPPLHKQDAGYANVDGTQTDNTGPKHHPY